MARRTATARLAEFGITLPPIAAPVAAYVPAARSGNHVWTAGQLPFIDGVLPITGKVGVGPDLVPPDVAAQMARTAALNALSAVEGIIGSIDRISRVVRVAGYVASDPNFTGQPAVINGASEVIGDIFGEIGIHARSAVGVNVLPLDSPVEIELLVEIDD